jgi:hypothetical protein
MGASFRRDGRGLPSQCSPVRANPLLSDWSFASSCSRFRGIVGMENCGAASRSVPPRRLRGRCQNRFSTFKTYTVFIRAEYGKVRMVWSRALA